MVLIGGQLLQLLFPVDWWFDKPQMNHWRGWVCLLMDQLLQERLMQMELTPQDPSAAAAAAWHVLAPAAGPALAAVPVNLPTCPVALAPAAVVCFPSGKRPLDLGLEKHSERGC